MEIFNIWEGFVPWRSEKHVIVEISTDASGYKWGAVLHNQNKTNDVVGDYWDTSDTSPIHVKDTSPIHVKEAKALLNALKAFSKELSQHRVDARVDNMAVVYSWNGLGAKDPSLNDVLKQIFQVTQVLNIDLKLNYVASESNLADFPSRSLSNTDCTISCLVWTLIQKEFGDHTVDLMALDSNAMIDSCGNQLKHFTPFPTPNSAGVNVFAQELSQHENYYVFPPFCLIFPVLKFLMSKTVEFTLVVPKFHPKPMWWPLVVSACERSIVLGRGQVPFVSFKGRL